MNKLFRGASSLGLVGTWILLGLVYLILSPVVGKSQNGRQLEQEESKKRTALVIGNADYVKARTLLNPANDATDIAKALSQLGFEVISGTNLNFQQMNEKVREFGDKLKANGGVGLFYYAGHGIQVGGRNYLIPVEAEIPREDEVDFNALNLDLVLRKMATANNGLNIIILDACRNNPFARSWSRGEDEGGLAQITAPTGTFIAYATSPDRTASDGKGKNGLYTSELLKIISNPNQKIEDIFKQVTIAVDRISEGKQVPWISSSLRGEFYFKSDGTLAKTSTKIDQNDQIVKQTDAQSVKSSVELKELEEWEKIKNSKNLEDFNNFLNQFPNGMFANQAKTKIIDIYKVEGNKSNPNILPLPFFNLNFNVFLIEGENRIQMKIVANKQDYSSGGMLGIGGFKQLNLFNGGHAQLRVKNGSPEFEYMTGGNIKISDVVFVVKLKAKSEKREIQINQKTFSGFKKEDLVPITFEEGPAGKNKVIYKIKFPAPLPAGEYAVVVKEPIGKEFGNYSDNGLLGIFFDFGIDK